MGEHYAALWIPWLLIAFAAGVATLVRPRRWTTIAFVLCAIVLVVLNPAHPQHYLQPSYAHLADARSALGCVPAGTTVATHDEWYTAVSGQRPEAMVLGAVIPPADYLVVADDFPSDAYQHGLRPQIDALRASGAYAERCRFGHVVTLARAHAVP
jgi:hypothetical protein